MGALSDRISNRHVAIGVILALALGFGLLFLHYHTSFATQERRRCSATCSR